jgi:hypothetical protein
MTQSFFFRPASLFIVAASILACQSNETNLLQGGGSEPTSPSAPTATAPPPMPPVSPESGAIANPAVHDSAATVGTDGLPANHPPLDGVPGSAQGLAWTAPAEWESQPPSSDMRLAQWSLPGTSPAECAVFNFAGGGTAQDNVQRWVRQFEPTPGVPEEEAEQAEITSNGLTLTLLRAGGTYLAQGPTMTGPVERRPDHRLFGAITTIGEQMYFLKCVGPSATMLSHQPSMEQLARSLQPAAAAR